MNYRQCLNNIIKFDALDVDTQEKTIAAACVLKHPFLLAKLLTQQLSTKQEASLIALLNEILTLQQLTVLIKRVPGFVKTICEKSLELSLINNFDDLLNLIKVTAEDSYPLSLLPQFSKQLISQGYLVSLVDQFPNYLTWLIAESKIQLIITNVENLIFFIENCSLVAACELLKVSSFRALIKDRVDLAKIVQIHPKCAIELLKDERLRSLIKFDKSLLRIIAAAPEHVPESLRTIELKALIKNVKDLKIVISAYPVIGNELLSDVSFIKGLVNKLKDLAAILKAYPGIADKLLQSLNPISSLIYTVNRLATILNACPMIADKLLSDPSILTLIKNNHNLVDIIEAYPAGANILLNNLKLFALIESTNDLVRIIQVCPTILDILLKKISSLSNLIKNGDDLAGILVAYPAGGNKLLSDSSLLGLIQDGNQLVNIIKAYPVGADKLLSDSRLLALIQDGNQLVKIIKVYPDGADKLLSDSGLLALIQTGDQLVNIIEAYPTAADNLLNDPRLLELIQNGSQLALVIQAYPAAANKLLNNMRLFKLIEKGYQLTHIIQAYPAGAAMLLNNQSVTLIEDVLEFAYILKAYPAAEAILFNNEQVCTLIKNGRHIATFMQIYPAARNRLLSDPAFRAVISDLDQVKDIIKCYPAGATLLLEDENLQALICDSKALLSIIKLINPTCALNLLKVDRLRNLITQQAEWIDLVKVCPAAVAAFPNATDLLIQISTFILDPKDTASWLIALTAANNHNIFVLFQTYIVPFNQIETPLIIKECLEILHHLHKNQLPLAQFTFGIFVTEFIAECRNYLKLQTINYLLCDAIKALLEAFANVTLDQQRIIANELYHIELLFGENEAVATLLYEVKPTLQVIDQYRTTGRSFEGLANPAPKITAEIKEALESWQAEHGQALKPWQMKSLLRAVNEQYEVQLQGADLEALGFYISAPTVIPKTLFLSRSANVQVANSNSNNVQVRNNDFKFC